jgi:hypothetical protein
VTGYRQVNAAALTAGALTSYTLTGGSSGIPTQVLGVLCRIAISSATVNSYVQLAPHGASDLSAYVTVGNISVANTSVNSVGTLAVDASGRVDVKAFVGTCSLTLYTYGYIQ